MWKRYFFQGLGIISTLMMFFGVGLSIREFSRDTNLFVMWLAIAIAGFLGLCVLAVRIMVLQKKINTPREKEEEKK